MALSFERSGETRTDCTEAYGGNGRVNVIGGDLGGAIARWNVSRGDGGERHDPWGYPTNEVGCEGVVVAGCDG